MLTGLNRRLPSRRRLVRRWRARPERPDPAAAGTARHRPRLLRVTGEVSGRRWAALVVGLVALAALEALLVDQLAGGFGLLTRTPVEQPGTAVDGAGDDPAALVDPFVGTAPQRRDVIPGDGVGGAFPGAAAPFGMVQWGPDTSGRSTAGSGGYRYADSVIDGFSLTHLHGTSCPAAQDLAIMPATGLLPLAPPTGAVNEPSPWAAGFSHNEESASPGRYGVQLASPGGGRIGVDLAAGTRTAIGRFTYPATGDTSPTGGGTSPTGGGTSPTGGDASPTGGGTDPTGGDGMLIFDAGRRADGALRAQVHVDPGTGEVTGSITGRTFCRQPAVSTLYFVARPDRPPTAVGTWSAGRWSLAPDAADEGETTGTSRSASVGAWLRVPPAADGSVTLRTAVSYVSVDGARANLAAEFPVSVEATASATRDEWNRRLSTVRVAPAPRPELRTLYTALYHAMLGPGAIGDADGRYRGWDGSTQVAQGWTARTGIAGWDAYRSTFPLLAMLAPDIATDAARSLLAGATQTGSVPGWTLATSRPDVMPGDGGTVLLAEAVAFGLPIDAAQALNAALQSAARRPFAGDYDRLGFVPAAPAGPADAASITLEYALADFATAQLALAAGRPDVAADFSERAGRWRSVWNPQVRLPAPRGADGAFLPVEPTTLPGYTEGTAAQYAWLVPQDPDGLAEAMGGREAAADRLTDFLARLDDGPIGARAELGNQPSLLTPWLGSWFGVPALTTRTLDEARRTMFRDTPEGLPGNDDAGGLSAWYVLAWLGLGPVQPGTDLLALTPPASSAAEVDLARGPLRLRVDGTGGPDAAGRADQTTGAAGATGAEDAAGATGTEGATGATGAEDAGGAGGRVPVGLRHGDEPLSGPWVRFRDLSPGSVLTWSVSDRATNWGSAGPPRSRPPATGSGTDGKP